MSTSLLYHSFSIRGYKYVRTQYQGGEVIFTIRQNLKWRPGGGSHDVRSRGHVERRFRSVPIRQPPHLRGLGDPRVECQACGVVSPGRGRLRRRPADLHQGLRAVRPGIVPADDHPRPGACDPQPSWDVIKDIQKRDLTRRYAKPKLKNLRKIAIDEIAIAKGHRLPDGGAGPPQRRGRVRR